MKLPRIEGAFLNIFALLLVLCLPLLLYCMVTDYRLFKAHRLETTESLEEYTHTILVSLDEELNGLGSTDRGSGSYAELMRFVSERTVERVAAPSTRGKAIVSIWDDRYKLIYSSNTAVQLPAALKRKSVGGQLPVCRDITGEVYYYAVEQSAKSGFRFLSAVPYGELDNDMNCFLSPIIWLGFARSAGFLALTCGLAFWLHRPWKRLARAVPPSVFSVAGQGRFGCFDTLNTRCESLSFYLEQAREPVRQRLLSAALGGCGGDEAQPGHQLREVLFNRRLYRPVAVALSGGERPLTRLPEIRKWVLSEYDAFLPESYAPDSFLLILGFDGAPGTDADADLRTMREMLAALLPDRRVCFGVGGAVGPEALPDAVAGAYDVLRYRVLYGGNTVLFPELRDSGHPAPRFYPSAMIGDLESAVMACDRGKTEAAADSLEEHIRGARYSPEMASRILDDVYGRLLKCCFTFLSQDWAEQGGSGLYRRLCERGSLIALREASLSVADAFQARKKTGEEREFTITTLYQYIEKKYCDYDFSVQGMASYFEVSTSHLTYYFKKLSGSTVLDYVNNKRMDRAMQLLNSTSMPINEIVNSIGFSDASTFIKKFKKHCGVTPGLYKGQASERAYSKAT